MTEKSKQPRAKKIRPTFKRWADWPRKPKRPIRCPFCLESLPPLDLFSPPKIRCPICQHDIPRGLLRVALHRFNRAQKWTRLVAEMDYILRGQHSDVNTYFYTPSDFWNPDLSEAKDRLVDMMIDRDEILQLRKEFMAMEGDLDVLAAGHIQKKGRGWKNLGQWILNAKYWGRLAEALSRKGASVYAIREFQLEYVKDLFWASMGVGRKDEVLKLLAERLKNF